MCSGLLISTNVNFLNSVCIIHILVEISWCSIFCCLPNQIVVFNLNIRLSSIGKKLKNFAPGRPLGKGFWTKSFGSKIRPENICILFSEHSIKSVSRVLLILNEILDIFMKEDKTHKCVWIRTIFINKVRLTRLKSDVLPKQKVYSKRFASGINQRIVKGSRIYNSIWNSQTTSIRTYESSIDKIV